MNPASREKRPAIIILGALSAIAEAAARLWAERQARLLLAGRDAARLDAVAADLRLRGAEVETFAADLAADQAWRAFPEMAERLGQVDIVLLAYGTLGDQKIAEAGLDEAQRVLTANFTSAAGWCLAAANVLEKQQHGTLIVMGSVAGDRGRASNYIYGAAKGGLAVLVQGVAHRLAKAGARAVLVKPGFVDTPMTAHIGRKGPLWAKPDAIGKIIAGFADSGSRNRTVVYAPGFWRWIMLVIRAIPNSIFHRTKL
jgi:decaprenylphospho-beta-D-erythro-pentofuranosid-2-ulose 2-reductase